METKKIALITRFNDTDVDSIEKDPAIFHAASLKGQEGVLAFIAVSFAVKVLAKVRTLKSEYSLAMNAPIEYIAILNDTNLDLSGIIEDLKNVTCAKEIQVYKRS